MKEYQSKIQEIKIYERIKAESGFSALIKEAAGQPSRHTSFTILTDDEKKILDEFTPSAVNECIIAINRCLSPCTLTEESENIDNKDFRIYTFNLMLPENFPQEMLTTLNRILVDYISNRSMQQWYMLAKAEDADVCAARAQSAMALLRETLYLRSRPQ